MRSLCLVVPRSEGEEVRKKLSDLGLLNLRCKIREKGDKLLIPIIPTENHDSDLPYPRMEDEFDLIGPRVKTYKDLLTGLPDELIEHLPTSFDIIGDIALVKLPEELYEHSQIIGKSMIRANPSIRLVAMDRGVIGKRRVRDLEIMAGEGGFETEHREHGLRYNVDVSSCYFSPRLATERERVSSKARRGERVLDMFAGVGPFSLLIARTVEVEQVWAVDINPVAIKYLKLNLEINGIDAVEPIRGDVREVQSSIPPVDRVIMNLPQSGREFLRHGIDACANDATIHYYEVTDDPDSIPSHIERAAALAGRSAEVIFMRKVRTYSPSEDHFGYDIKVFTDPNC